MRAVWMLDEKEPRVAVMTVGQLIRSPAHELLVCEWRIAVVDRFEVIK